MKKPPPKKPAAKKIVKGDQPNNHYIKILFAILIIVLYGRSVGFEYTLDDDLFIKNNPVVQKGIAGIGETFSNGSLKHFIFRGSDFQVYRPVMISSFCIQQAFFGFAPGGYHFVSMLLYFLLSLTLLKLLRKLFPKYDPLIPVIITLLFIVHPVHSEVVANVKSQDELLSALFCILALIFSIKAIQSNGTKIKEMSTAIVLFLLALFSKESSAFFLVVFPLTYLLLLRMNFKKTVTFTLPFFFAVLFYLLARFSAVKGLMFKTDTSVTLLENVLYGAKGFGEHTATRLSILFEYVKMMIVPFPLSWDYSYNQIPVINWNNPIPFLSLTIYLLMAGIIVWCLRKRPDISFGYIMFLALLAPLANIFFINGATLALRFLFMPSAGFITSSVLGIIMITRIDAGSLTNDVKNRIYVIAGVVILIFSYLTYDRCGDWKNNFTVFESGAMLAPNSSRTNDAIAKEYMNLAEKEGDPIKRKQLMEKSVASFKKSLTIYPDNYEASYKSGLIYEMLGDKEQAVVNYLQCLKSKPDYVFALNNLGVYYSSKQKVDSAIYFFSQSYLVDSSNKMTITNLAIVNSQKADNDQVIFYGLRAMELNYGNEKIYNLLSNAYFNKGDMAAGQRYREMLNTPATNNFKNAGGINK